MLKRSGFKPKKYDPSNPPPLKIRKLLNKVSKNKVKKSARAKKMGLKREIIEQYGLPMLPCSRYGKGKAPTRQDILKGMLWHVFSLFIRTRDKDKACIACSNHHDSKQAGHYAPIGSNDLELAFSEVNVNGECPDCNGFDTFHLVPMRKNLINRYGKDAIEQIDILKGQKRAIKWEESKYVEKIKYYFSINENKT